MFCVNYYKTCLYYIDDVYAKIRLDALSLQFVIDNLHLFDEPLTRQVWYDMYSIRKLTLLQLMWTSLWNMVRDAYLLKSYVVVVVFVVFVVVVAVVVVVVGLWSLIFSICFKLITG